MRKPSLPEFDRHATHYEADLQKSIPAVFAEDQYFSEYKIRHMARFVGARDPERLLDYGCGVGRSLYFLNQQFPGAELWGYDVSGLSIEKARQCVKTAYLTSNPDDLPVAWFDVIFAANVFHHIPCLERKESLAKCKDLLREEGRIFLFEHNPFNPVTRHIFERCPYDENAVMLQRREVLQLANAVDLKVVRSGYTLFFPRQLAYLRPLERVLKWLPLGAQYCVEMAR